MNKLLSLLFPSVSRGMPTALKWSIVGICLFAFTDSQAQCTNCEKFQVQISLDTAIGFDEDFGVTADALFSGTSGAIEVRVYAQDLYTTGGRADTHAFLYGIYVDGDEGDGTYEEPWQVTPYTGECLSGSCGTRSSEDFKPRFLRVWKELSAAQSIQWSSIKDFPPIDVVVEVDYIGGADSDDVDQIILPGNRRVGGDDLMHDTTLRGYDFIVESINRIDFDFVNQSYANLFMTTPSSTSAFYKIMPGRTTEFLLAKDIYQIGVGFTTATEGLLHKPGYSIQTTPYKRDIVMDNGDYYSLFKVTKLASDPLFFAATPDGPFVVSNEMNILQFKQNTANEKFLNRSAHPNELLVAAHRGNWQQAGIAENTIPAYEKAIELGTNLMEVDVRKTSDGKFVIFHDENADRLLKFGNNDMSLYKNIPIERYSYITSNVDSESGVNLPALAGATIKDRFRNEVVGSKLLLFDDLITYVKDTKSGQVVISLDHSIDYVKPLSRLLMLRNAEDNFFWKGNGKADPSYWNSTNGILMQQIAFTPVFQEWVFKDPGVHADLLAKGYDAIAYWNKYLEYKTTLKWTIPGVEVNFKKEISEDCLYEPGGPCVNGQIPFKGINNDPGVTRVQHDAARLFVDTYKANYWIGLSPWYPLFGEDPWSLEEPTNTKNAAAPLDWRADMSFCLDYCHLNYLITDHPKYTVDYWTARGN